MRYWGRLREAAYAGFFGRFIAERDRLSFSTQLEGRKEKTRAGTPLGLDYRNLIVEQSLFPYLRSQRINKILDDAKVLAIPTGVKDAESRNAELKSYASTGLALLGLAGLFVPVLGEVMLGVAALQVADEVYEGYQDWRIGDRQAALGHLFSVAETIVVGAALGAGATAGARLLERVSFVDGLVPVLVGNERLKLCSSDMSAYRVEKRAARRQGRSLSIARPGTCVCLKGISSWQALGMARNCKFATPNAKAHTGRCWSEMAVVVGAIRSSSHRNGRESTCYCRDWRPGSRISAQSRPQPCSIAQVSTRRNCGA